jgi:hypothetical protein
MPSYDLLVHRDLEMPELGLRLARETPHWGATTRRERQEGRRLGSVQLGGS